MGDRVTFDYSKAEKFIGEHEVKAMERIALQAKEVLVERSPQYPGPGHRRGK